MAALDYKGSSDLMKDADFIGRVKVSCLKFADYILLESATVPAHNTRVRWANQVALQPEAMAAQVTPLVVMDPSVQEAGADVTDVALQSAVEAAVNKML